MQSEYIRTCMILLTGPLNVCFMLCSYIYVCMYVPYSHAQCFKVSIFVNEAKILFCFRDFLNSKPHLSHVHVRTYDDSRSTEWQKRDICLQKAVFCLRERAVGVR